MVISETAFANDRFCDGGSDAIMGKLEMSRCARGDYDGSGYDGTVDIDVDGAVV